MRKVLLAFGLMAVLLIAGCAEKKLSYTVEEVDGISMIHNNEIELTELEVKPELIIGSEDESTDDNVFFSGIAQVLEAPSGDIYVLDMDGSCVNIFDNQGKLIRKIGREGQGPGEFNRPFGIAIQPDGNLLVADSDNQRYQIFDKVGELITTHKIESDFPGRILYDNEGQLINHKTSISFEPELEEPMFYVYNADFEQVKSIGIKDDDEMMEKYFNNLSFFDVNSQNMILAVLSAKNEFIFYKDGEISSRFDRYLNYKPKDVEVKQEQVGDSMTMTISYEPICFGVAFDSKDNIYALTKYNQTDAVDEENPDYYSVLEIFDPTGIQLKRIPLRNMGAGGIAIGKDDKIYIVNDENATVVRYPAI